MEAHQIHSNHALALSMLAALLVYAHATDQGALLSCLTHQGVRNFTTFSSSASTYTHFLHHSLHNLIYSRPSVPRPFSIVLPETKHQLASTVACARNASLTIRIRSGGHSTEGSSSTADGTPFVIIDLMNLNRISIDVGSQTAWVEAGATLGEVYYAVSKTSDTFAVAAGWSPTVGTGGHISGGGSGILTRKYGLAADNVIDAVLVDADGRLLDREGMGEDVFWAIRGGGGGVFGAIFAWKIKLVTVPKSVTSFSAFKTFPPSEAANLLYKLQHVAPNLVEDFSVMTLVGATPDGGVWVRFYGLFLGPKSAAVSSGGLVFSELGVPIEECKEMSWVEAVAYMLRLRDVSELTKRTQSHKRAFKLKSDFFRSAIPEEGFAGIVERLLKEPHALITLLGLGGAMASIRSDAVPFPHREGNLFVIEYAVSWNMEEDSQSDVFVESLRELYEYMAPFASKNPRAANANHMDYDLGTIDWGKAGGDAVEIARSWGEKYFLGNYDRLVRAKTIIDPNNVFRHPQSIPPVPPMCRGTIAAVAGIDYHVISINRNNYESCTNFHLSISIDSDHYLGGTGPECRKREEAEVRSVFCLFRFVMFPKPCLAKDSPCPCLQFVSFALSCFRSNAVLDSVAA
ncbi:hypothetical protein ACLOJK_032134 [Asimina triloba]